MIKTKIKYAFVFGIGMLIAVMFCELPVTHGVAAYARAAPAESAISDDPHLQAALEDLRLAKAELDKARADKGGHHKVAYGLINGAIAEIEKEIAY